MIIIDVTMDFVDRGAELGVLKDAGSSERSSLVTIYGRRRIGKTDLITRFMGGIKGSIYYMATKEEHTKQLRDLSGLVGMAIGDEELIRFGAADWEALFHRIGSRKASKRLVIAIDEFPYLVKSNAAISSVFQKGWDLYLKDGNVTLILCGSSISMMHSEVLDYSAPLYHRSTSIIEIQPLGVRDALSLNHNMAFAGRIRLYFMFGGVPAYYAFTEACRNIREALRAIFRPGSAFLEEPSTILSEETRSEARYIDLLDLISNGINRTNEMASKLGMRPSNVSRYLDVLERIGVVRKSFPVIGAESRRSKRGVYEIRDNYIRFWFRHVKRNRGTLGSAMTDAFLSRIESEMAPLEGTAFEGFVAESVPCLAGKGLPAVTKAGRWWGEDPAKPRGMNREEIDVVGINEETKEILFAECKWSDSKADLGVYDDLRRKSGLVAWNNGRRREHFAIFSKAGFTEGLRKAAEKDGVALFDIAALEKALG